MGPSRPERQRPDVLWDWHPKHKGILLAPVGVNSIAASVNVSVKAVGDSFARLYEKGYLTGQALRDAQKLYGGKP